MTQYVIWNMRFINMFFPGVRLRTILVLTALVLALVTFLAPAYAEQNTPAAAAATPTSPAAPAPGQISAIPPLTPQTVPTPTTKADEFAGGAPELKFTRYSDDRIQLEIEGKMKVACRKDRCRMFSVTSQSDAFVVELNGGYGSPNGAYGNGSNGGGSVIVTGTGATTPAPSPYVGLTLRYVDGVCTQSVDVPESLYIALNTYIYHLMSADGSTRKNFTPAEQTMMMFYTTILTQAKGCAPVTR